MIAQKDKLEGAVESIDKLYDLCRGLRELTEGDPSKISLEGVTG